MNLIKKIYQIFKAFFLALFNPIEGTRISISTAYYGYREKWIQENPQKPFIADYGLLFSLSTRLWTKLWTKEEKFKFLEDNRVTCLGELIIAVIKKENPKALNILLEKYPNIKNLGKDETLEVIINKTNN